jgi:general stress protein CsbA
MSIVIPILFFVAILGVLSNKITVSHWIATGAWIIAVVGYNFMQH